MVLKVECRMPVRVTTKGGDDICRVAEIDPSMYTVDHYDETQGCYKW
jgi:hypothetical protein